jgi:DNA-binding LacI/PurR family transcriptional regulator
MKKKGSRASSDAIQVADIAAFFEEALSRPPSEAGKLLRSERDFASLLGVHRMKVHRALNVLVENGILARRQGSGTFVRKVPASAGKTGAAKWEGHAVPSEDLFAGPAKALVRKQASQEHRKLNLLLVTCWDGETIRSITAGIRDRAKQEGHDLKVCPLDVLQKRGPKTLGKSAKGLCSERIDGCMVWTHHKEVIKEFFGDKIPPIVYIGGATRTIDLSHEPLIRHNLEDAIIRALTELSQTGYKRIGFVGAYSELRNEEERKAYEITMDSLGAKYRSVAFCPLNDEGRTLTELKRMFTGPNKPDAVYVADDILLRSAAKAWKKLGIVPGKNLAVITLSNRSNALPAGFSWSCMQFDAFQVGRMVMDSLLLEIQTAGEALCSFEHLASWRPGTTHLIG